MGAIAKEFKTIVELVQLLESRGIATDETTAKIIQKESYYAVVNGYKDSFLDKSAMQDHAHDVYKPGTTFNQIYSLFLFDRELRWTLFPYLTTAETVLKNAIVYAFCERYRDPMAYLDRANYASAKDMLVLEGFKGNKGRLHSKSLADLMARFNGKIAIDGGPTRPFIRHYMEEYGFVEDADDFLDRAQAARPSLALLPSIVSYTVRPPSRNALSLSELYRST